MLAKITSATVAGLDALPIDVEVDVASRGLPSLTIVGLPDKGVQEAKERVRSALMNSGTDYPAKRITINLAPADLPKAGAAFDLPIALGLLIAKGDFTTDLADAIFVGELSLDGHVRSVPGALPVTIMAKAKGFKRVFLPRGNAAEAAIITGVEIFPVDTLSELVSHLTSVHAIVPQEPIDLKTLLIQGETEIDFADIHGQEQAKRAMEIAAAGGHNIFLKGVPGAGKTMLSRAFAGILPRLTVTEALELTKIYSVSGNLAPGKSVITNRPFRNPHHTTSKVGLIGGGSNPKPGEISLSHRGVLFLDEFPEFPRSLIESLRQPMEDGVVQITRASQTMLYPARFVLVAAANPCPCGNLGSPRHACTCSTSQIIKYQQKISGPMLDRIDIHLDIAAVEIEKLSEVMPNCEDSKTIRTRVQAARNRQLKRFVGTKLTCNADMTTRDIKKMCPLDAAAKAFLTQATDKLGLTARSYFKTIKVARTIADLSQNEHISIAHLAESLQYRAKVSD